MLSPLDTFVDDRLRRLRAEGAAERLRGARACPLVWLVRRLFAHVPAPPAHRAAGQH